jgi:hypothetical protein
MLVKNAMQEMSRNLSRRSHVVLCGPTEHGRADGRTDFTTLIVTFRNCFVKAPKNPAFFHTVYLRVSCSYHNKKLLFH